MADLDAASLPLSHVDKVYNDLIGEKRRPGQIGTFRLFLKILAKGT